MHAHPTAEHVLHVTTLNGCTFGECACGQWRREVTTETVAITGRSREDALRAAHDLHVQELTALAQPPPAVTS
ncbi:MAG TPA: hypothetical protein VM582_09085 [Candidatus Thermoplasmatota archaeon]|nr:hypothetical protein [Candidatus Thermoplasmatota archaeon]